MSGSVRVTPFTGTRTWGGKVRGSWSYILEDTVDLGTREGMIRLLHLYDRGQFRSGRKVKVIHGDPERPYVERAGAPMETITILAGDAVTRNPSTSERPPICQGANKALLRA